jgi:DNA primase
MAGRITQKFLDDLLDRVDIVEVVDRRVKLKKTGKNYSARCPFHDEKTPSFSVNPDKQFYYCFGCGAGGNALGFVMDYDNIDFPQAVENLAGTTGMTVEREEVRGGRDPTIPEASNKPLYALLEQASNFYQLQLRKHPEAKRAVAYLKQRGLTGAIAKEFDLGFAPPGWDNLLSELGTSEEAKEQLQKTGMVVKNEAGRIYDRFRDRVVFPIRDQRGRIIAFGGRVLGDDKPKYLNSPETDVFHKGRELYGLYQAKQANRRLERILVVEGYMDVIALAQHGISNATATLGTATSKTHLERIYRLCPEVVFCFDGDEAGRKAAFRAMEAALPCMEDGRQARFLFLPEGEDPDTMVRSGGAEHFQQLVANAQPLETFLFESLAEGIDIGNMDGRARLSKLALPYIRQMPEGVYKQLMFQDLANRTGRRWTLRRTRGRGTTAQTRHAGQRHPGWLCQQGPGRYRPAAAPARYCPPGRPRTTQ